MADLTPRQRAAFIAAFVVYAGIVIPLGVRKGDDITTEITQAHLTLEGQTLYNTPQTQGVRWPHNVATLLSALLVATAADVARGWDARAGLPRPPSLAARTCWS